MPHNGGMVIEDQPQRGQDEKLAVFQFECPPPWRRRLKIAAIKRDTTMTALIISAVDAYLKDEESCE